MVGINFVFCLGKFCLARVRRTPFIDSVLDVILRTRSSIRIERSEFKSFWATLFCVLGQHTYSQRASLQQGVQMGKGECNVGGNPVGVAFHPGRSRNTLSLFTLQKPGPALLGHFTSYLFLQFGANSIDNGNIFVYKDVPLNIGGRFAWVLNFF